MKKYIEGEKDEHRLTVEGLSYLRSLDREIDSRNWLSPFRASRCFCKELRRVILAFAARIASVLVSCCFGCGVLVTFPAIGIIGSACVGSIDERLLGCVLIGPVGVNVPLGILDNSLRSNPFNHDPVSPQTPPSLFRT